MENVDSTDFITQQIGPNEPKTNGSFDQIGTYQIDPEIKYSNPISQQEKLFKLTHRKNTFGKSAPETSCVFKQNILSKMNDL